MSTVDLLDRGLRPLQVSAGEVVYPPGGRLGPRWQPDLQLMLVHSGGATVSVDGRARPAQPAGWVGLLLPGHREEFAFATCSRTHHSWVQVRLAEPSAQPLERFAELPTAIPASGALTELVREAVAVARTPLSTGAELLAALATAALWRYSGDADSRQEAVGSSVVARARLFLHTHTANPDVDLRQVAAAVHVSPPHLVRRFRAELGVTPMAYFWQRRVSAGVDLLTHTGLPVGDVAARCGFKSVYHFSRKVRQHTGVPPTHLRRQRWEGSS